MIKIRTIEEFKAVREWQLEEWIDAGKEEYGFYLRLDGANLTEADLTGSNLTGADLRGAKIKDTIITQSLYDQLAKLYSHEVMVGFIVKELEVAR